MTKETSKSTPEHSANQKVNGSLAPLHQTPAIRALNDYLRRTGRGGVYQLTAGVAGLGFAAVERILKAIAAFDGFTPDNDPYGEHDCAVMEIEDQRVIWKIDYYDRTRTYHSPDPANPKVTVRVLTVMLSSEY